MEKLIKLIMDDITIIPTLSIYKLTKIINYSNDKYFNTGDSILSDEIYDIIIEILNKKNIDIGIGSKNKKNKSKLDYWVGSINKIKYESNDLENWCKKIYPPYTITDKLDGVSALLIFNDGINMYTRGDGEYGFNINNILKKINIPSYDNIINYCKNNSLKGSKNILALRGELIIKKSIFLKKWETMFKDGRTAVSGLVNSKTINIELNKDIDLVIYEIIDPVMSIQEQLYHIKLMNFTCVDNITITNISYDILKKLLIQRRLESFYKIDGIVITGGGVYDINTSNNPEYKIALKNINDSVGGITNIIDIEWNVSKNGSIIPTLILNPVEVDRICIKRTSGHNAKYIVDNKLGKGAVVEIVRSGDTIPYIKSIISKSTSGEGELPNDIEWIWNDTNTDIKIIDTPNNDNYNIKNIYYFFSIIETKGMGIKNVEKLYKSGYNTIEKIIKITYNDLIKIDNFKDTSVNNLLSSIKKSTNDLELCKLMIASNKLGDGIGKNKIEQIINNFPDILDMYKNITNTELVEKIIQLDGWEYKSSQKFVDNLKYFIKFYAKISKIINIKNIPKQKKDNMILFTVSGWKPSNEMIELLYKKNYKFVNNLTKDIKYLIIKSETMKANPTEKIKKAIQLNITIITKDQIDKIMI